MKKTRINQDGISVSLEKRFTAIFEREKKSVFSTAYYILGCREDAEETVQAAFLKLWERRSELEKIENTGAWLKKIVVNLCLDRLRAAKRQKRTPVFDLQTDFPEFRSAIETIVEREKLNEVMDAVKKLPPAERTAILLYTVGGFTTNEIAGQLGTAASTVRNQLLQARRKINEIIQEKHEKN